MEAKDIGLFPFKDLGNGVKPVEELLLHPMDLEKPFKPTFNRPQQKQPLLQDLRLLSKMNSFSQGMDSEIKPQQDA